MGGICRAITLRPDGWLTGTASDTGYFPPILRPEATHDWRRMRRNPLSFLLLVGVRLAGDGAVRRKSGRGQGALLQDPQPRNAQSSTV